jgi:hypothetical protein
MAHLRIDDLRCDRTLDARLMSRIRGGDGAPWVFGWILPYIPAQSRSAQPVVNFYQINNYADQMINQYQVVSVNNSGPNAVLTVGVDGRSTNNGQLDGTI